HAPSSRLSLHDALPIYPGHIPQDGGKLVYPPEELLVGEVLDGLRLRFGHKGDGRLVPALLQVAVHAVGGRVQPAPDEPAPEGRGDRKSTRLNSSHVKIS